MAGTQKQEIQIRTAAREDAAAMAQYLSDLIDEGLDVLHPPRMTEADEVEALTKAEKNGRAFFLLVFDGDRIVGMLDLQAGEREDRRHMGRFGVSLLAPYRGKGLGTKLIVEAERRAREWPGFCRIELEVASWNDRAIKLYERLGFRTEGQKVKSIYVNGDLRDSLWMAKVW